jgi:hypothetical protein
MSDFNYIEYLKNNPLLKGEKTQSSKLITESQEASKSSKMKKSELKAKIREQIFSTLNEEEDYEKMGREVEYGIGSGYDDEDLSDEELFGAYDEELFGAYDDEDFEHTPIDEAKKDEEEAEAEVDIPVEDEMDIEIDTPEVSDGGEGLSAEEQKIQNSLKVAYDNASAIGDEKLANQIGNSITFFTRTHVVER